MRRLAVFVAALVLVLLVAGCASAKKAMPDGPSFEQRAHKLAGRGLVIEAAALGREESIDLFGVPLNDVNVQPVWLRITSFREDPFWVFPTQIDSDYFPTAEVARRASRLAASSQHELYQRLSDQHLELFVPPGTSVSGFVFAHSDEGMKAFNVDLHSPIGSETFNFVVPVPGLPTHYFELDDRLAADGSDSQDLDLSELRAWLQQIDCCARNDKGQAGDPLNLVFIGTLSQLRSALIARHWDVTAPITGSSLRRLVSAFLFGSRYRYAPISRLYLFGREQDLAFQKSRAVIDERNHMRIWLAPVTFQGTPVWVGQVSRDIGVKLSHRFWPPTTHVIDPDVDDARFYVLQDMLAEEKLQQLAFVQGHRQAPLTAPHHNAEGDPYFTDGLRAVMFLGDGQIEVSEVVTLDWALPPAMEPYRAYYVNEKRPAADPTD